MLPTLTLTCTTNQINATSNNNNKHSHTCVHAITAVILIITQSAAKRQCWLAILSTRFTEPFCCGDRIQYLKLYAKEKMKHRVKISTF